MSASTVIGDVTQTLEELLTAEQLPADAFSVSVESPADVTIQPSMKPKINLFLFRVQENPFSKSEDWRSVGQGALRYPPLSLQLFYLMTPFAEDQLDEQRVFGEAMRVFYEHSIIPEQALQGGLQNTTAELKLILCPFTMEQLTQIWGALDKPYRLSVCYEVRMVSIDARTEREVTRTAEATLQFT
jgi:Pvc16 N-terminal domain